MKCWRVCGQNRTLLHCWFSSITQLCLTLCDPMDGSTPGFPVHHQLPELAQTHVHQVGDAIQPSRLVFSSLCCPQSFPASGSFPMSQCFTLGGQSIGASASAICPSSTGAPGIGSVESQPLDLQGHLCSHSSPHLPQGLQLPGMPMIPALSPQPHQQTIPVQPDTISLHICML